MASYPSTIVTFSADVDYSTPVTAEEQNNQWGEIVAIETILDKSPASLNQPVTVTGSSSHPSGTVAYNIDMLNNTQISMKNSISSLQSGANATELQGRSVSSTAPSANQALVSLNGSTWGPAAIVNSIVNNSPLLSLSADQGNITINSAQPFNYAGLSANDGLTNGAALVPGSNSLSISAGTWIIFTMLSVYNSGGTAYHFQVNFSASSSSLAGEGLAFGTQETVLPYTYGNSIGIAFVQPSSAQTIYLWATTDAPSGQFVAQALWSFWSSGIVAIRLA